MSEDTRAGVGGGSEYRTQLRERVEALGVAALALRDVLDAGTAPSAVPPEIEGKPWVPCPDCETGCDKCVKGHLAVGGTLATSGSETSTFDVRLSPVVLPSAPAGPDVARKDEAPAPAVAPEPRRWWVNVYANSYGVAHLSRESANRWANTDRRDCVPVIESSSYDAMRERAKKAEFNLASLRRTFVRHGEDWRRLDEMMQGRGCYDPALTVAQNARARLEELSEWLDQRTNSANALLDEVNTAQAECRLKDETIADLRAQLAAATRPKTRAEVSKVVNTYLLSRDLSEVYSMAAALRAIGVSVEEGV